MKYIKPVLRNRSFTCPHCGTIAEQKWWGIDWSGDQYQSNNSINVSKCVHCRKNTLWIYKNMYYPDIGNAPFPNIEMPESVNKLYIEAASIQSKSPRGAAALLRLGIQKLCKELGEKGNNINEDISKLVRKGLPEIVQESLDIVRVTGNEAVHPGQIDTDDPDVVVKLFELVNVIVEYMIALPKKVSGIYSTLPMNKLDHINKRDKK